MPHVSKVQLDKRLEAELLHNLEVVFGRLSATEMGTFLTSFLSKTERIMLSKRLAVAILLRENMPQAQIARTLGVTQATVSRMELFLESRGQGYGLAFKKLSDEKMVKEFKDFLVKLARYSARAAGGRI